MSRADLSGKRYGLLTVIRRDSSDGRRVRWACVCDCGQTVNVITDNLTRNHSTTCGGAQHRALPKGARKRDHPAYQVWREMIRRCTNPSATSYRYYGAKGIRVCDEWLDFDNFIRDMGDRPSAKHQIDREHSTEDYCKAACKWVTAGDNSRNRDFVKLDNEKAAIAKQMILKKVACKDIAIQLGVTTACIQDISRGRTWKHVSPTTAPDGVLPQ